MALFFLMELNLDTKNESSYILVIKKLNRDLKRPKDELNTHSDMVVF